MRDFLIELNLNLDVTIPFLNIENGILKLTYSDNKIIGYGNDLILFLGNFDNSVNLIEGGGCRVYNTCTLELANTNSWYEFCLSSGIVWNGNELNVYIYDTETEVKTLFYRGGLSQFPQNNTTILLEFDDLALFNSKIQNTGFVTSGSKNNFATIGRYFEILEDYNPADSTDFPFIVSALGIYPFFTYNAIFKGGNISAIKGDFEDNTRGFFTPGEENKIGGELGKADAINDINPATSTTAYPYFNRFSAQIDEVAPLVMDRDQTIPIAIDETTISIIKFNNIINYDTWIALDISTDEYINDILENVKYICLLNDDLTPKEIIRIRGYSCEDSAGNKYNANFQLDLAGNGVDLSISILASSDNINVGDAACLLVGDNVFNFSNVDLKTGYSITPYLNTAVAFLTTNYPASYPKRINNVVYRGEWGATNLLEKSRTTKTNINIKDGLLDVETLAFATETSALVYGPESNNLMTLTSYNANARIIDFTINSQTALSNTEPGKQGVANNSSVANVDPSMSDIAIHKALIEFDLTDAEKRNFLNEEFLENLKFGFSLKTPDSKAARNYNFWFLNIAELPDFNNVLTDAEKYIPPNKLTLFGRLKDGTDKELATYMLTGSEAYTGKILVSSRPPEPPECVLNRYSFQSIITNDDSFYSNPVLNSNNLYQFANDDLLKYQAAKVSEWSVEVANTGALQEWEFESFYVDFRFQTRQYNNLSAITPKTNDFYLLAHFFASGNEIKALDDAIKIEGCSDLIAQDQLNHNENLSAICDYYSGFNSDVDYLAGADRLNSYAGYDENNNLPTYFVNDILENLKTNKSLSCINLLDEYAKNSWALITGIMDGRRRNINLFDLVDEITSVDHIITNIENGSLRLDTLDSSTDFLTFNLYNDFLKSTANDIDNYSIEIKDIVKYITGLDNSITIESSDSSELTSAINYIKNIKGSLTNFVATNLELNYIALGPSDDIIDKDFIVKIFDLLGKYLKLLSSQFTRIGFNISFIELLENNYKIGDKIELRDGIYGTDINPIYGVISSINLGDISNNIINVQCFKNVNENYNQDLKANFIADIRTGEAPLEIQFINLSTGNPLYFSWKIDGVEFSTDENPTYIYNPLRGLPQNVSLTITRGLDSDTLTKTNYIEADTYNIETNAGDILTTNDDNYHIRKN